MRPDFRYTEIVKYYQILPLKRGYLSYKATSLIRPDFRYTEIVKYYQILPLKRIYLSYKTTFSLLKELPYKRGTTVFILKVHPFI
jgi:hypothetical protein